MLCGNADNVTKPVKMSPLTGSGGMKSRQVWIPVDFGGLEIDVWKCFGCRGDVDPPLFINTDFIYVISFHKFLSITSFSGVRVPRGTRITS